MSAFGRRSFLIAPVAALVAARLRDTQRLGFTGIGPVRIGMTEAQFRSAVKIAVKRSDFEQDCSYLESGAGGISFMLLDSRIARVDITSGSWRTEAGAGVGTSETEIRRLYPGVNVEPHPYYDESLGHYFRVTPASPALRDYELIFETERGAVTSFRAGLSRAVSLIEGCA